MTAFTVLDTGFLCPTCEIRDLVRVAPMFYRCQCCHGLYRFALDAMKGIVLTLMEERVIRRMDALPIQPAAPHPSSTPRLSLVKENRS